jgi:hypothetical protein
MKSDVFDTSINEIIDRIPSRTDEEENDKDDEIDQ